VPVEFEVTDRAAAGRLGRLHTPHGVVDTPTLLPVVNPNLRLITPRELKTLFGADILITNSYVIHKHADLRDGALEKGLHALLDWDGAVMTDSGTFQQYVYGDVKITNEEVVAFQRDIRTDIGTALDVFSTPQRTFQEAKEDMEETARRVEAAAGIKGEMALAATVQGGVHPLLREEAARRVAPHGDVFPIGGVVPLMEQQRYAELARAILAAKRGLPAGNAVHLFGCGHPMVFPLAVALGCDLFDSSAYAKYAKAGRYITSEGTQHIADMAETICPCPVCSAHTPAELARLAEYDRMRLLAEHNLYVTFSELKRVREAIRDGTLWELVERRATAHPTLLEALDVLREEQHKVQLEATEPISGRRALFMTGPHTVHRPLLYRLHERLRSRYSPPEAEKVILFDEAQRPFSESLRDRLAHHLQHGERHFIVDSWLGPVPIELDQMYPFAQSVVPRVPDAQTRRYLAGLLTAFIEERLHVPVVRDHEDAEDWTFHTQEELYADPTLTLPPEPTGPGIGRWNLDLLRVAATADMQFGRGAADALLGPQDGRQDRVRLVVSPRTMKVRNIQTEGEHVASLRAEDGLLSLTMAGARRLHAGFAMPQLRVVVTRESAEYNAQGRNVMSRFVSAMDPALRPGDDCLVVDEDDTLVAHGRVILTAAEAPTFRRGLVVRIREGSAKRAREADATTPSA
jgi:7-cyano-7-deazaguanine tRNA-ribosyltransferase